MEIAMGVDSNDGPEAGVVSVTLESGFRGRRRDEHI